MKESLHYILTFLFLLTGCVEDSTTLYNAEESGSLGNACEKKNPELSLTPSSFSKHSGDSFNYNVTLKNINSSGCAAETFLLSYQSIPTGFTSSLPRIDLDPGASKTFSVSVATAKSLATGNYTMTLKAWASSAPTYSAQKKLSFELTNKTPSEGVLAFPGAQGFGKNATGGRGGKVIKVTNLNDKGPGSLREALQYTSGARTIVFEVGGTITLKSVLSIPHGNVTVAGQTAPGGGILIKGSMVMITSSNVIMRYIRFRPGRNVPENESDGLSITAWGNTLVENVIVDHCSLSWALDEAFETRTISPKAGGDGATPGKVQNITLQNSIISENVYGVLNFGNTYNKTFYKNLFAFNQERNVNDNYPTDRTFSYEMINNIIYGCYVGTEGAIGAKFTVLNNLYKQSSDQSMWPDMIAYNTGGAGKTSETYAFISGNIIPAERNLNSRNLNPHIKSTPYATSGILPMPASMIANDIISHVGASLPKRDAVDIRLINHFKNGTGRVAFSGTHPVIPNGRAPVDTDNDGMPDDWEKARGLNPFLADNNDDDDGDGYTNLEEYLNF